MQQLDLPIRFDRSITLINNVECSTESRFRHIFKYASLGQSELHGVGRGGTVRDSKIQDKIDVSVWLRLYRG